MMCCRGYFAGQRSSFGRAMPTFGEPGMFIMSAASEPPGPDQPQATTRPARTGSRTPLLSLQDVGVRFGAQPVLHGISLAIPRGKTLVVIGQSGCGKTVLLRLLIGLLRPSTGQVLFDNKDLASLNDRELTRQRLRFGFLFQGAA